MRRVVHSLRPVFFFAFIATLAACTATTSGGTVPQADRATDVRPATSSSGDLLYIGAKNYIETYAYPAGTAAGSIKTAFNVVALCSDTHGNVFALGAQTKKSGTVGAVYEYAHGLTQVVATLPLPAHQFPVDCSSDPTTSNLAVTSYSTRNYKPQINIYLNAGGTPQTYESSALGASPAPAYDQSGDLYVTSGGSTGAYMPANSSAFVTITTNVILGGVAHAQWDGKYFALQSFAIVRHQREHTLEHIYRFTIAGSTGTLEGVTHFTNWYTATAGKSWISGDTMVATPGARVAIWGYPGGGKSIEVLHPANKGRAVTVSTSGS
jgi:hypothetical protein